MIAVMTNVERLKSRWSASRAAGAPAAAGPELTRPDSAARLIRLVSVLPAMLAVAWLLAGLPLLLLHSFRPVPMLVIAVPLATLLTWVVLRQVPYQPLYPPDRQDAVHGRTPWWSAAALLTVALAFGADQFAYRSQQIIVQRDPAAYVQFASWIARHGYLPIPDDPAAFGGMHGVLSFDSAAFEPVGHALAPQFMAGQPMTLAAGFWLGGVSAAVAMNALIATCGVLALGGLTARLVGPRWAPLAALALAVTLPEQFTARSAFSEPLVQVLLLGGLCLVIDALSLARPGARLLAVLGGLAIGLTLVVRIDGASDMLPLIPYCGMLAVQRRRVALPLAAALCVGVAYGLADGVILTRPYLHMISGSLRPLAAIAVVLTGLTGTAVLILRDRLSGRQESALTRSERPGSRWIPWLVAAVPGLVIAGLVIRPYVQTVHGEPTAGARLAMIGYQVLDHLPVQPTRLYYELSLHWVFWYLGLPAVLLATVGGAVLARRCVQGAAPEWVLPLVAFGWIIVATLLRPAITPDQPWASRRLVPGVLPGFILLAIWAAAWLTGQLRARGVGLLVRGVAATLLAMMLVLPAVVTSFGLAARRGGPLGVRVVATGTASQATFQGEIAAVAHLCASLPGNASVVFVDRRVGDELAEVVRGMCGVPSARLVPPRLDAERAVVAGIGAAGRTPVLLAATSGELSRFGGYPRRIIALSGRDDEHTLETPPLGTDRLRIVVWLSEPGLTR
jgi:hypothetical protein